MDNLIELYVQGKMSRSEAQDFLEKIKKDPDQYAKLQEEIELAQGIEQFFLKEELQRIGNDLQESEKPSPRINYSYWAVAAGVAVIALVLIIPWRVGGINYKKVYDEFYVKDAGLPIVMGVMKDPEFAQAMITYKLDSFALAEKRFKKLQDNYSENDTLAYYIAMSQINQNKWPQAKPILQSIDSGSYFYSDRNYYLGLHCVLEENIDSAKIYLKKSNHPYAKDVLKKLDH